MKNAYAAKLQAQRNYLRNEERAELIHRLLTTIYQATAVELNRDFGFGSGRIAQFRDGLNRVIEEYGVLMNEVDADYADGKLEQMMVLYDCESLVAGYKKYKLDRLEERLK